jgi:hypothetical protein
MPYIPILGPVVALAAWTLIMMLWMFVTRFGAMGKAGISLKGRVGARGNALDGVVDDRAQWKSHNYNHLMEQPTLFYAVAISLALLGGGDAWINVLLAWLYVGFRVVHSLIQATVNVVRWRFLVFALASLCLIGLTVHAAAQVIHDGIW